MPDDDTDDGHCRCMSPADLWWLAYYCAHLALRGNTCTQIADHITAWHDATVIALEVEESTR